MLNYCFVMWVVQEQVYQQFMTAIKNFPIEKLPSPKIEFQMCVTKKDMPVGKNQKKYKNEYQYNLVRYNEHYLLSLLCLNNSEQVQKFVHGSKSMVQMFEAQQMLGEKTIKVNYNPTTESFKWGNYIFTSIKLKNGNIQLFIEDICASTFYKQLTIEVELRQRLKICFESVSKYVNDMTKAMSASVFQRAAKQQLEILHKVKSATKKISKEGHQKQIEVQFWMLKKIILCCIFTLGFEQSGNS